MNTQHRSQIDPFTKKLLSYAETGYRVALTFTADTGAARELARDAMTALWLRRAELEQFPAKIKTELLVTLREFYLNKHRAGVSPARFPLDASGERPKSFTPRQDLKNAAKSLAAR